MNAEGYRDPTADGAVKSVTKSEKRVKVGDTVKFSCVGEIEYIGRWQNHTVVKIKGYPGLIPVNMVRRIDNG